MDDYSKVEVSVLFTALEEEVDRLKHYPGEFTEEEADAVSCLFKAFHQEAQYRGIIY